MTPEPATSFGEDEESFLRRRAEEERRQMAETSCVVRSVHEELDEEYEGRVCMAEAVTAGWAVLAAKVG